MCRVGGTVYTHILKMTSHELFLKSSHFSDSKVTFKERDTRYWQVQKNHSSKAIFISSTDANASMELFSLVDFPMLLYQGLIKAFWLLLPKQTFRGTWALQLGDRIGIRLLVGLLLPFKSSFTTRDDDEASKPELLFIDTVDRLLVGEAVKDLSGDDMVVAVELVEFIFLKPRGVGMPECRRRVPLLLGDSWLRLVWISNVLLAVRRWPIFAKDKGSL